MAELDLTIALDRYDRHVPLFMGLVEPPPGLRLDALEVGMTSPCRDGKDRHNRFLQGGEFDIAETSLSSHIIATSQGAPFVGIPVFPRRLFSQNHIYVRAGGRIQTPNDLAGKQIAIRSLQTTMSVLAIGDLANEYGVEPRSILWRTAGNEVMPLKGDRSLCAEPLPRGVDVGRLLIEGKVDAMIFPHPPRSLLEAGDAVRPLFPDRRAEALRYHARHHYYPIMHLIAFRRDLIEAEPWLAEAITAMWEKAKHLANDFYEDPGYAQLAFARNELDAQIAAMGDDPWPSGLAANRANLKRFIGYMVAQGLIDAPIEVEALFHPSTHGT